MGIGERVGENVGERTGSSGTSGIFLFTPTNFTMGTPTDSSIPVSWTAPAQGSASEYRVKDNTTGLTVATVAWPSTGTTVVGLSPSTAYTFYVVTSDGTNESDPSNTDTATTTAATFDVPAIYLPDTTTFIHWSVPVRAYPGVDVDFKLTGYDWQNRTITWSLDTAPSGMTINSQTGVITWIPADPGQLGNHTVTARMTLAGGAFTTRTWIISVNTTDFIFVATTGSDTTGTGTIGNPYATVWRAQQDIVTGDGQTIYIRGGTYTATFLGDGSTWLFQTLTFPTDDYVYISAYESETVIFDQTLTEFGFKTFAQSVGFDKIEIKNCTGSETGGFMVKGQSFAKRCHAHDNSWNASQNCTGFLHSVASLLDSCLAHDNFNATGTTRNNSDYVWYGDQNEGVGSAGHAYVIDCVSGADTGANTSIIGFKIKHASTANNPVHYHRCVSRYCNNGFTLGQDYASMNHCIAFSPGGSAVNTLGGETTQQIFNGGLLRNSTCIATGAGSIPFDHYDPRTWYSTQVVDEGMLLQNCTLICDVTPSNNFGHCIHFANFTTSAARPDLLLVDFQIINNQMYTPGTNVMERTSLNFLNVTEVNALTNNSGNTNEGTPPASLIINNVGGGLDLTKTSWTWNNAAGTLS